MSTSALPVLCDEFNSSASLQTPTQTPSVCISASNSSSSASSSSSMQLPSMNQFTFNSNSSSRSTFAAADHKVTRLSCHSYLNDSNDSSDSNDTLALDLSAEHKHEQDQEDHDTQDDDTHTTTPHTQRTTVSYHDDDEQTPRKVADGDQDASAAEDEEDEDDDDNDNDEQEQEQEEEEEEEEDGDTSVNSNASHKSASTSHARSTSTAERETTQCVDMDHLILGRFGYEKVKDITRTLQGSIFIAKAAVNTGRERQVVIKKTSKSLHAQHVTVQNGKKFGIYENILKECIILKYLTEHRNGLIMTSFTKYDNFFDDARFYFLSMEHGGSDLFDYIIEAHELLNAKKLKIKEWRKFTKYLFWQMIVVLRWLHNDMNTCHLDLSLENILIKNGNFIPLDDAKTQYTINSNVQIKLCDFGLAEIFNKEAGPGPASPHKSADNAFHCTKYCGKTNYKAPEVYSKNGVFDARKADVWSLGVVLFCMLVGSPPYNKPVDSDQAYLYVKNGIIDQLLFQWERNHFITVKVLSLLHNMLCFDSDKRFLVDDVIQHSWLSLYYHKYKHQMSKKSQLQQQSKHKRNKARLPYYKLPQNAVLSNISQ